MGKGGQEQPQTAGPLRYKLTKDIPTLKQIRAVIPNECFEHSLFWSLFYLARDLLMASACVYACAQLLSTDLPTSLLGALGWVFGWSMYAFWMGTVCTGLWVLAHECGHGGFSQPVLVVLSHRWPKNPSVSQT